MRGLFGIPLGVFIGYLITILISLTINDGSFYPCVPQLITVLGSEIAAVTFQAVLCGILGSCSAMSSVVFQMEHWSITKMTVIHFLILSFCMLPTAYFTYWVNHSISGILSYFGIFLVMYALIWVIQRVIWKKQLKAINQKLSENK